MPRVAIALLLTVAILPFSAGAAGHDVSAVRQVVLPGITGGQKPAVRYAPANLVLGIWT